MRAKITIVIDLEDIDREKFNWVADPIAMCNRIRDDFAEIGGITIHGIEVVQNEGK